MGVESKIGGNGGYKNWFHRIAHSEGEHSFYVYVYADKMTTIHFATNPASFIKCQFLPELVLLPRKKA